MKISDLLGEGWESDDRVDTEAQPRADASPPAGDPPPPPAAAEPVETRSPDVIASLASWAPAPEAPAPETAARPVSARAQLADLAAGLAVAPTPVVEPEPEETTDELAGLHAVVDDLLPASATKRKGSSRASSRSGSRHRGR